ncbi:thioesterase [Endozoicomonas sp. OPT23]|uniref:hotdog fold thioesterase n=1 Tax=Endozoicomonas sp. OPT23 TaxID=2072845 RepID=UPI00129AE616|nr:hotdog fold thioesterase [Endozoicomonas sp. OPT23]MRI33009.1 thioesterase [Endozoicomonas sp. OPT23]
MSIWKKEPSLDAINQRLEGTICDHIGITVTAVGGDSLTGTMPVDQRTIQPAGILHGGSSVVLAETLGSVAANLCSDEDKYWVGLEVNANHIKSVTSGLVTGTAKAVHVGRSTQVWEIRLENEKGQLTCISRLTMAAVSK